MNILKDELVEKYIDRLMLLEFKSRDYYKEILKESEAIMEFLERTENRVEIKEME